MFNKNCEYCARESHERKNIVDNEEQVTEVIYIEGKPFLEVEKAVDMGAPAGFFWEFTRVPIEFCPKCGGELIETK